MSASDQFECLVVGAGPAGLAAAGALAKAGADVGLVAAAIPPAPGTSNADGRTAALFPGSLELLRNLGAWSAVAAASAPITAIRIVDDTGRLLRAPEVIFTAQEIGLRAFGANVPTAHLTTALRDAVEACGRVGVITTAGVTGAVCEPLEASITTAEGRTIGTRLLVAADGRNSVCRRAAGITAETWSYPQSAIVTRFSHSAPHGGVSTEFHRRTGPCTTVPLPGNASSLVWVDTPEDARRLAALADDEFMRALEERLHGLLGPISAPAPRQIFPLAGMRAARLAATRIALIGEAAHVIPPIGAQGLNLGFRDAAMLADCVADARRRGADPGGADALGKYAEARAADIASRVFAVDTLNRSLLSSLLPVHLARGLGLHLLGAIPVLKRELIRAGLEPQDQLPSLMRKGWAQPVE